MDQRVVKSLLNPYVYPEATENVRLVQTHISYIFIADDYVYKIKKPVDFGFLNFTTLDRRRFFCNEEVRLNSRLSPGMYLGVVEVRESDSGATFRGNGKVIDYAVKMKRLPESRMLDRMLAENRVTAEDIREVAKVIASFHLRAERGGAIDEYGASANIRRTCEDNFRKIGEFAHLSPVKKDLEMLRNWVNSFITTNERLFADRVKNGFIRDCDGDIHLENICLTTPVAIFDCIEFNDRFRFIDTTADIAFFLMDLDFHGKKNFSGVFLDEYIRHTADTGLTRLLDFYKVNRAIVRCKVESLKVLDPDIPDAEKLAAMDKALRYFRLSRGYVVRRKLPQAIIITCGPTGTGKSFIAAALAFELGMQVFSSDAVRKELANIQPDQRCLDRYGKGIYSPEYNEATYRELMQRSGKALDGGESVIIDATFRRRPDRDLLRSLASCRGIPLIIVRTDCPDTVVKLRLEEREQDPDAISDGRWELYPAQKDEFEPPQPEEGIVIAIDTSRPLDENINEITRVMGSADESQDIDAGAALSEH